MTLQPILAPDTVRELSNGRMFVQLNDDQITTTTIGTLCGDWNAATSPSTALVESDHAWLATYTRKIDAEIRRRFSYGRDWKEFSDGSRWPIANSEVSR